MNIYTYTVPAFVKLLGGLRNILDKAEAYAKEKGIDEKTILADALAPDMFPLKKQIQVASDNAKGVVSRLADRDVPKWEDSEETFAELRARIDKTLGYVQEYKPEDFEGAENRQVTLPYFPGQYMTGTDYALEYALSNFIFHVVTAYGIIRKNGVPIGKTDFINGMPLRDL